MTPSEARAKLWQLFWAGKLPDLSFIYHDGQKKIDQRFRSIKKRIFIALCSRQLGKTVWALSKVLETGRDQPGARMRYGTAFYTDLAELIVPALDFLLHDCPEALRPKYVPSKQKLVFPNGSECKFIGLDLKPQGMRGNRLALVVIDEAGFVARLARLWASAILPTFTHSPGSKLIMISTSPEEPDHDFWAFCDKAELNGALTTLTVYDNPLLTAAAIEELCEESGGENSSTWQREYLCKRVVDQTRAICGEFEAMENQIVRIIEKDQLYPLWHKYVAIDVGVRDYTVILWGYWHFQKAIFVVEDELPLVGNQVVTDSLARALKAKEAELWGQQQPYRRIADSSLLFINDLSLNHQISIVSAKKGPIEEGVNALRVAIKKVQIAIHPRCKFLIGSLKAGVWDKQRKCFARSKTYGHFDAVAALTYAITNVDRTVNPVPFEHGVDLGNTLVIRRPNSQGDTASTLRSIFGKKFE